jgi:hypothetical protein
LDRRSPVSRFSSSERLSIPDRLSFVVRLSPDRFLSSPIGISAGLPRIKLDGADYRRLQARESPAGGLGNPSSFFNPREPTDRPTSREMMTPEMMTRAVNASS